MQRCLQLAKLGAGYVAPNPMVGAVLVHEDRVIGEGYHRVYGQAHAEVNCLNSVAEADRSLIGKSTLYVSLEPCAHHGKTPPCADLVISMKIPRVVIGCRDSYQEVDGRGIGKLEAAGVEVTTGVLEAEARELNRRFFTYHEKQRPYVILKWAQSGDGHIAAADHSRVMISNPFSNRLVHKWRSEEAAIMVGSGTAIYDNPALTTRLWKGKNPTRVLLDRGLRLQPGSRLFSNEAPTIVFNEIRQEKKSNLTYTAISSAMPVIPQVLTGLHQSGIQSVLVEGGARLLQAFIDEGCWDEARIIKNEFLRIPGGIAAPLLEGATFLQSRSCRTDTLSYY